MNTVTVDIEYTDTFGGEANYSWVRLKRLTVPADISDRALVRRAKREMGLTGVRCRREGGCPIVLYPHGTCTVLFIADRY